MDDRIDSDSVQLDVLVALLQETEHRDGHSRKCHFMHREDKPMRQLVLIARQDNEAASAGRLPVSPALKVRGRL